MIGGDSYFVPSHLTKGLIASGLALGLAIYAAYEFSQVTLPEVTALIKGS